MNGPCYYHFPIMTGRLVNFSLDSGETRFLEEWERLFLEWDELKEWEG